MRSVLLLEGFVFPILYVAVLFAGYHYLTLPDKIATILDYAFKVAFILLFIRLVTTALTNLIKSYLLRQDETGIKLRQVRGVIINFNVILWLIGIVFLFDNLGFNVTAILTGLGVGGIAIALAAQTILGDLFNYFVIFFDQPFEVGDFIIVDDKLGSVEYIGLKTTRIRSLQGEQIVFSNTNLTNSRIHNFKRMQERRVLFKLALEYGTPAEKLEQVPSIIGSIVEAQADTRFDRAHFSSFGAFSLDIEVVYYLTTGDYNKYMDTQQQINLSLYRRFSEEGISFAFPTYSIGLKKIAAGAAMAHN